MLRDLLELVALLDLGALLGYLLVTLLDFIEELALDCQLLLLGLLELFNFLLHTLKRLDATILLKNVHELVAFLNVSVHLASHLRDVGLELVVVLQFLLFFSLQSLQLLLDFVLFLALLFAFALFNFIPSGGFLLGAFGLVTALLLLDFLFTLSYLLELFFQGIF